MFGVRRSPLIRPSFWSNALITALILFGPAIEDSVNGKSVLLGLRLRYRVVRCRRFVRLGERSTLWNAGAPGGRRHVGRRTLAEGDRHDLARTSWSGCR